MQPPQNPPSSFLSSALAPAPALTLNPAHPRLYQHPSAPVSAGAIPRPSQLTRTNSVPTNGTLVLDPTPGDPGTTFIRPPFTDFPGSENYKGGLTYTIMAANPEWFLDVKDFVGENAVGYPTQLEPPRGWCPAKKKDVKDGWKEGEEPRLRCTFCRRTYAGVNAKSMWRRHVYEKHKVPMANRRETADKVGGRGGRGSNKENKLASKGDESEKIADKSVDKSVRRTVSLELPSARTLVHQPSAGPSRLPGAEVPLSPAPPVLADAPGLSEPVLQQELFGALSRTDPTDGFDDSFFQIWHHKSLLNTAEDDFFFRATPPQTPGLSPSKSSATKPNIPPESPYDPTRTPAFRHSPARLPSDQPWRASGAAVSSAVRQLTLGMLVCGEASPNVRGLDVSPIVIVPASERKKRSVFSPPSNQTPGSERMFSLLDMHGDIEPDMLFPSPRRLFADVQHTPSIMSRMGDFAWPSPMKGFNSMGFNSALASAGLTMDAGLPTPSGEVEDPFKAYLHLSPAPKVAGDSSPSHPPSSSRSNSPASRSKSDVPPPPPELQASPSPVFGPSRSSISMSKLRLRVFPENDDDVDMDGATDPKAFNRKVDMASLGLGTPLRVQEHLHSRGDSSSSVEASFSGSSSAAPSSSGSDKAPVSSGSTGSTHSRRDSSPFRFGSHGRQRSASGSSHKSSLGSSSVATVGLMDKILGRQEKPQRRRTSHNHDGEVAVDSMGSPFKLGRKTSRNEFLYSLDGDCEMQEAQPKKRRKTISGRE